MTLSSLQFHFPLSWLPGATGSIGGTTENYSQSSIGFYSGVTGTQSTRLSIKGTRWEVRGGPDSRPQEENSVKKASVAFGNDLRKGRQ